MDFLKPKGDYRNLIVYKKAGCIFDIIPPDIYINTCLTSGHRREIR